MSKRNPFWLRQIPEYSLVWGALDLTPYLYDVPHTSRDALRNWFEIEFELWKFDEQLRIDLYLMFNESIEKGTPLFYAGYGYHFQVHSYHQTEPSIKGLLAESPIITVIKGVLRSPHEAKAKKDSFQRYLHRGNRFVSPIP